MSLVTSAATKFGWLALFALLSLASPRRLFADTSPLADAAEKRDGAAVRALLDRRVDVNAPQVDGMTALHWATCLDDSEMAKLLVSAGANVKAENRYGVTPLSLACRNGNTELVELFLNTGADPNASLRGGETVLMTAARTGNPGPVKALLARGADINAKERKNQTALMWAAAEGHTEVVELLIQGGADIHAMLTDSGFTPLFFAVREGRVDVARALLRAGANVNGTLQPTRRFTRSPLPGTSPLLLAIENGHFELAEILLEAGADPNDQRSGFTALHTISWVRKPNRGDGEDGDPPPIGSGKLDSLQCVRKLVQHGADVNARLKTGKSGRGQLSRVGATPFLLAAFTDDVPLMKLLVELGADPLLGNADGATPLMAAAGLGVLAPTEEAGTEDEALEAVQYLLSLGEGINGVDKNGETAMHGAAYKNFPKVVQLLADKGAKIEAWNHKNKWGWTPLQIAEGYRPGNFKPSADTIAALQRVMLAAGVTPPKSGAIDTAKNSDEYRTVPAKKSAP